jgi:stage V sporulation protein D (sporulation-specific penicillin-binding protein)
MADILPYLGVKQSFSEDDIAGKSIVVDDLTGKTAAEAQKILKDLGLGCKTLGSGETVTGQIPAAGKAVPGGSEVLLYLGDEPPENTVQVPDFKGLNRQQASDAAGALGLYILVSGNSSVDLDVRVVSQSIGAGTEVPVGTTIKLEFIDTKAAD